MPEVLTAGGVSFPSMFWDSLKPFPGRGRITLRFLQGYGPPDNIDPLRDRFIGIVIGICIVTTVFALIWPESADLSARERLAACLRTIACLLRLGRGAEVYARIC